jgi:predicted acetyltransferase
MHIRRYRDGDLEELARVTRLAFGEDAAFWERYYDPQKNPRLDPEQVHVVEEDGGVRATATVLPLECFVDGAPVPVGGVAAVATHPAYRRRDHAGGLMRTVLADMRERGVHLSMLWPFAHAFYRRFGYEIAGESVGYALEPTDLPSSPEQKLVRAYREEDLPRMMVLLETEAARHPLCVRRREAKWREYLGRDDQEAVVYERDGRVKGYLLYRQRARGGEPHRTLDVSEMVAGDLAAREALLSFMAAYNPDDYRVRYATPRGRPLHPYLRSSYVKAEVEPEFMVRLVDVGGALGLLDLAADPPLTLEVADDGLPENTGPYTVGDGEVVRGAEAEDRVALDVRQLAQLYAGYLPAEDLHRNGRLEVSSPEALALLDALFPAGDPWAFPPDHF